MNASYSTRMLPPAPTFSPATFHDTDVSLDPSEEEWKIRPADAIRLLCASAIARSRQPRSKTTCPRSLRALFIQPSMSRRGVQAARALGASAPKTTVRASVSPRTLTAPTRPRLIGSPPCQRATPVAAPGDRHRHRAARLERDLPGD